METTKTLSTTIKNNPWIKTVGKFAFRVALIAIGVDVLGDLIDALDGVDAADALLSSADAVSEASSTVSSSPSFLAQSSPVTFCGSHDIDWLQHMVNISSGSEQAHWIAELKWAIAHQ